MNVLFTTDPDPISSDALTLTLPELDLYFRVHENYIDLQSQQFLLNPVLSDVALSVASENDIPTLPTLTYLANSISTINQTGTPNATEMIPYSTILALPTEKGEFAEHIGKFTTEKRQIGVQEKINNVNSPNETPAIYLNKWAAADLGVKVGDKINIAYYTVNASEDYITENAQFLLKGIVPIAGIAADASLIPKFPGIHDTADISKWEPPFPIDYNLIRQNDETYWDKYKATPKAFISLDIGKRLWQNRFGDLTTIRLGAAPGRDIPATRSLFETEFLKKIKPMQIGFRFMPLQEDGIKSATGSTDFGMLFSSLSGFIIIAVALLVGMVFRIGVEQRSREIGILQAVGYTFTKIRRRFLFEGTFIASFGCLLGCLIAIGYARLMIYGLHTWWLPAIGTTFIKLHISILSLVSGAFISLIVMIFAIQMTIRKLGKVTTTSLLAGETNFKKERTKPKTVNINQPAILPIAIALIISGLFIGVIVGGNLFSGGWSGFIVLFLIVICLYYGFRRAHRKHDTIDSNITKPNIKLQLLSLGIGLVSGALLTYFPAVRSISKSIFALIEHPVAKFIELTLTTLFLGLTVFAEWLSSQKVVKHLNRLQFALKNAARQPERSISCVATISLACCIIVAVGANRHDAPPETEYAFVAEASLPLHHNINTPEGRLALGFDENDSELFSKSEVFPFRVLPGEDVSCLNLYQPKKPQILGATEAMLDNAPWKILKSDTGTERKIHAIGDEKSLRWILHHNPDEDFPIQDESGQTLLLELDTVKNSLFQSQLIISETDFTKYFPSQSGYQFYLIKTPPELREQTLRVLESTLENYGFDVTAASDRLASFRAVENTYISTFQSLGGLGILLGTFGLGLVLFRNIIERRGELATLRAFGFRRQLLSRILFLESCFLLTIGMLIGVAAGLVAIIGTQGHLPAFPWLSLTITLLFIYVFGIIANSIAVTFALRSPLLSTLKTE